MITLNDGRQVELISIHNGQVDFKVTNRSYGGIYVTYAAVADPASVSLPEDTPPEEVAAAMQAALEAAIAIAEPIVKAVLDAPPVSDGRMPSARDQVILANLPSWTKVSAAVDNIGDLPSAKAFIKKLTRVVYWLAKDKEE